MSTKLSAALEALGEHAPQDHRHPRRSVWRRLLAYPPAVVSAATLCFIAGLVIAAPAVVKYDPLAISDDLLQRPSTSHWFGTDESGRDILARLLYGGRVSLVVGAGGMLVAGASGTVLGLIAGTSRGVTEALIMRVVDGLLAFPPIVLALAILSIASASIASVTLAVSVPLIPRFVRLVRGEVLRLREEVYVEAAYAAGATQRRVLFRVLLPNTMAPILVGLSLMFGMAILLEATVGFLGLGIQAPFPTWGYMINRGAIYLGHNPWYAGGAGLIIFLCVLAMNRLGDALRDLLDPKLLVLR